MNRNPAATPETGEEPGVDGVQAPGAEKGDGDQDLVGRVEQRQEFAAVGDGRAVADQPHARPGSDGTIKPRSSYVAAGVSS